MGCTLHYIEFAKHFYLNVLKYFGWKISPIPPYNNGEQDRDQAPWGSGNHGVKQNLVILKVWLGHLFLVIWTILLFTFPLSTYSNLHTFNWTNHLHTWVKQKCKKETVILNFFGVLNRRMLKAPPLIPRYYVISVIKCIYRTQDAFIGSKWKKPMFVDFGA